MSDLRQQPSPGKRKVPALRKSLKRPETYIAVFFLVIALAVIDSFRKPADQLTALVYIEGVKLYQTVGRPVLENHIRCRYKPTCSDYSIQAVQAQGIRHGLLLTVRRINSCQTNVPMGTYNPVPISP